MGLQDKLDALREELESRKLTSEAVGLLRKSRDELIAAKLADRAVGVGDTAPAFSLPDADGKEFSLDALLKGGPVVLSFYRGAWCPFCNTELQGLEAALPEIRSYGASLLAISPQTPSNSRKSQRDNELTFPVLADQGRKVASAYGLCWAVQDDLRKLYHEQGVDLEVLNGNKDWTLPMPARYVVASDGTVVYAEVSPDYTVRPDPSELIPTLKQLKSTLIT